MNKILKTTIIPLTASALLLGGCGSAHKDDKLIESKAGDVKTEDVMKKMGNDKISKTAFQLILTKVLEDKYGDKVNKNSINDKIEQQSNQLGGKDKLIETLKQQNMTEEDLKDQLKMQEYQDLLMKDNVKVSDKQIKEDSRKVSHILIDTGKNKKDKEKAKKKANDLKSQLDNGANFKELAANESDDSQTKDNAGSLGYIIKDQMEPSFEKEAFKLKEGEISKPVKTTYGYHIIKVEKDNDFKSHKKEIKNQIIQQKIQKDPSILTNAYKKVLDDYKVKYNDKDIKKYINNNLLNSDKLKKQAQDMSQQ